MLHLFHPAAVHFSVAFLVLGGAAEIWGLLRGPEKLARWGEVLMLVGAASLVPTVVTGYLAANTVPIPAGGHELLGDHERNGWFLLGVVVAGLFWKAWHRGCLPDGQRRLYVVLLLLAVALTIYSAWLGGQMVYRIGIGVQ